MQTRILVTHGLAYLKYMDNIVVLKDGKISETGTFKELLKSGGAFAEFLETFMIQLERNPEGTQWYMVIIFKKTYVVFCSF